MFVVKITGIATKTNPNFAGKVTTHYIGKDGYVHDRPEGCTPWKRKAYAELYIKKDAEWIGRYDRENSQHFWDYDYNIVEV